MPYKDPERKKEWQQQNADRCTAHRFIFRWSHGLGRGMQHKSIKGQLNGLQSLDARDLKLFNHLDSMCQSTKRCTTCNEEKSKSAFNVDKTKRDGFSFQCKACRNQVKQDYRDHNRGRVRQADASYKRRILLKRGHRSIDTVRRLVGLSMRPAILGRDGHLCILCGSDSLLRLHHIVPVSVDPTRIKDRTNLVTLCLSCHLRAHGGDWKGIDQAIAQDLTAIAMAHERRVA